jgi:hypothetical protein
LLTSNYFSREGKLVLRAGSRYKWIALSNTTLGMLMATVNSSIMLIALPDIFRGIGVDPLQPGNTTLLLWLLMGYLVVTAVLVVSFGRLGDMFGRVRMFNLGFAIFALFSVLLSATWMHGTAAAWWLIGMRILQAVGGAMLMANSSAILTDAFPARERGLALGLNQVAGIAGSFIGLVLGGLLGPVDWRLVFLVSVPFGVIGTVWSYLRLRELGVRRPAALDWGGNLTFAAGLIAVLVGITYGIHRHLLHADHPGPGRVAARDAQPWPDGPGRAVGRRGPAGRAAAGGHHVRRAARLQPDRHAARPRPGQAAGQPRRLPDRAHVLPVADLGAVPAGPGHRVRLRHRGLPGRGGGVAAARPPLRARGARPGLSRRRQVSGRRPGR